MQQTAAIELACRAGVDWIKNSSGWDLGGSPATVVDIILLVKYCIHPCKVKGSGKIDSLKKANLLLEAGAEMLGTSSAREIMFGLKGNEDNY